MEDTKRLKPFFAENASLSKRNILLVITGVLIIRALLTLLPSYQIDMNGYRAWSLYLADHGYAGFYRAFHVVYGPVIPYFLQLSGILAKTFSLSSHAHEYLIKLWAVLSDLAGAVFLYLLGRRRGRMRRGFLLGAAYLLNPAVFFNSSVWGQFDSLSATMLLGALYLMVLGEKSSAVALFVVSILTKPQSAFLAPIIAYLFFAVDFNWRTLFSSLIAGGAVYLGLIHPFSDGRPVFWLIEHYFKSGGDYPYATANAFNLWTLLGGQTVQDSKPFLGLTFAAWSLIFLALSCLVVFVFLRRRQAHLFSWFFSAYFLALAVFFLGPRMHERYLFPALIFLTALVLWKRAFFLPLVILSGCHLANQCYIYELARKGRYWVPRFDLPASVIAVVTLGVLLQAVGYLLRNLRLPADQRVMYGKGVEI